MSEETPNGAAEKLAARLTRIKPAEGKSRRRSLNPYVLSAVTAVAGAGVGAWLVIAAPEATAPTPEMPTASVNDFQAETSGADGFSISKAAPKLPQTSSTIVRDVAAEEQLQAEVDRLRNEVAKLQASPVTIRDEAALADLNARLSAAEADAKSSSAALSEMERENIRLQTELDTKNLVAGDAEAEAARAREEELARRRQEAEALRVARVNSDMIALRSGSDSAAGTGSDTAPRDGSNSADQAFVRAGAKSAEVRQAAIIANPAFTVMQGTLIEASLETAINTQLAGNVSAVVSHDVWSFDMSRVVIPRGSRLFGRYDSDISVGQRRVLIAWDRVVTTDAQSVSLAAFGTDRIGRSGLPGTVRTHFLQRFGTAAMISVIGAIPAVAAAKYSNDDTTSDTIDDVGTDFNNAVTDVMADYLSIPPTISVDQGAVVMVRVDADLEFY